MTDQRGMRRAATALAVTTLVTGAVVGPARKADASVHDEWLVPALSAVKTPPMPRRVRPLEEEQPGDDTPDTGAGAGVDQGTEATVTLRLTRDEAAMLRGMLHESVTNDLDLLEDTLYQTELVDSHAVSRVAFAVRLEVALE